MNLQSPSAVLILFATAAFALGMAIFAWSRRSKGEWANSFTFLVSAAFIWIFGYALEIGMPGLSVKIIWAQIQYFGIATVPIFWLIFARQYTDKTGSLSRLSPRQIFLLSLLPATTILLVFTNELHHLIWQSIQVNSQGSLTSLEVAYGPWFWIHSLYSYAIMCLGTWTFCKTFFWQGQGYRLQAGLLIVAALFPIVGNVLFISGAISFNGLDLTPFSFVITGLLFLVGIFWVNLFNLAPIARRIAMEKMGDGIIILDQNKRVVDVNMVGESILGRRLNEIIGHSFSKMPEVDSSLIEKIYFEDQRAAEIELSREGEMRYFDVLVSLILDNQKKEGGWLISLRDVTSYKKSQEALLKRTQLLEMLSSLSTDIASSLDQQAILNRIVESTAQLLDVTSVYINDYDIVGNTVTVIAEYFSPSALAKERESDLNIVYDISEDFGLPPEWGKLLNTKDVIHRIDPQNRHLVEYGCKSAIEAPLIVEGKIIGTLEVWESRYERDFNQEDIDLLLAIAKQAALALHNATLYRQALAASELKSQILTQVNHELRTPLSVILMNAQMQGKGLFGELTDKQHESNSKIYASAKYLQELVEQLLTQSKIENAQIELREKEFSPADIVEQVEIQLGTLADSKELILKSIISEKLPKSLWGDKEKIQQILLNLVGNAIKYTANGQIDLALFQSDPEHWEIRVSDTGVGISLEEQASIFEPFWQTLEAKSMLSQNGTGLGLSIVYQFVQLMKGEIKVESEVGKGSLFKVTLPLKRGGEAEINEDRDKI